MIEIINIITIFTKSHILCHSNLVHTLVSYFSNIHFNVILLSNSRSLELFLPLRFTDQNFICISHFSYVMPNNMSVVVKRYRFGVVGIHNLCTVLCEVFAFCIQNKKYNYYTAFVNVIS